MTKPVIFLPFFDHFASAPLTLLSGPSPHLQHSGSRVLLKRARHQSTQVCTLDARVISMLRHETHAVPDSHSPTILSFCGPLVIPGPRPPRSMSAPGNRRGVCSSPRAQRRRGRRTSQQPPARPQCLSEAPPWHHRLSAHSCPCCLLLPRRHLQLRVAFLLH